MDEDILMFCEICEELSVPQLKEWKSFIQNDRPNEFEVSTRFTVYAIDRYINKKMNETKMVV